MIDFEYFTTKTPFDMNSHVITINGGELRVLKAENNCLAHKVDVLHGGQVVYFVLIERYFCIGLLSRNVEFQRLVNFDTDVDYSLVTRPNDAQAVFFTNAPDETEQCRLNDGHIYKLESTASDKCVSLLESIQLYNI